MSTDDFIVCFINLGDYIFSYKLEFSARYKEIYGFYYRLVFCMEKNRI